MIAGMRRGHGVRGSLAAVVVLAAGLASAEPRPSRFRPDARRLATAPEELQARMREDPFVYFRFLNTAWAAAVCDAFYADLPALPTAILHGDAHLEQYALTATARGLDDFDDAAHGPSAIDLVRFLGSIDLVSRRRGWTVKRLRGRAVRTRAAFLAWGESLMAPLTAAEEARATHSLALFANVVRELQPQFDSDYFRSKRLGRLRMGVGSALARKILVRIEGPSPAADDDLLLEAKELSRLDEVPCLQVPVSGEAFRVVAAAEQIGRIPHGILAIVPRREGQGPEIRDWWVRDWDQTYAEVTIADFTSADELAEVARDAGAQFGSTNMRAAVPALEAPLRRAELAAVKRLGPRPPRQRTRRATMDRYNYDGTPASDGRTR